MPPAADIDDVIAFAATDIAGISYGGVDSTYDQMVLWNDGVFGEATGVFKPSTNDTQPGQRPVTNWFAESIKALDALAAEGTAAGDAGVPGTSAAINAVVRAAYAVKYAAIDGGITPTQQTAVVTLYNAVWQ